MTSPATAATGVGPVRRALDICRREGLKSIYFRTLGETVYRRMVLVEHRLDQPRERATADVRTVIDLLSDEDVADYVAFRPDTQPTVVHRRLQRGHRCFVARHDGRIVSAAWIATARVRIDYLACDVALAQDEAFLYESYTAPEFRGHSIPALRARHEATYFRDAGCRRLVAVIVPENKPALRHAEKSGWRVFGRMGYVKLGPWRRDFVRVEPGARPVRILPMMADSPYWETIGGSIGRESHYLDAFLGGLKRRAHLALLERWGGVPRNGRVLKTDLFEEAMGPDALFDELSQGARAAVGIDISPSITVRAHQRVAGSGLEYVIADVRCLPFADHTFALIVSPSTLDHFADAGDLGQSLRELLRVLEPEGRLIITLDNRQNIFDPLLRLAARVGLVPYYLGRSYRVGELCDELRAAGFVIEDTTAILHNPRLMAVMPIALANKLRWPALTRSIQRLLVGAQALERTRWRYYTGSFVAAKAVRRL